MDGGAVAGACVVSAVLATAGARRQQRQEHNSRPPHRQGSTPTCRALDRERFRSGRDKVGPGERSARRWRRRMTGPPTMSARRELHGRRQPVQEPSVVAPVGVLATVLVRRVPDPAADLDDDAGVLGTGSRRGPRCACSSRKTTWHRGRAIRCSRISRRKRRSSADSPPESSSSSRISFVPRRPRLGEIAGPLDDHRHGGEPLTDAAVDGRLDQPAAIAPSRRGRGSCGSPR